MAAADGRRVLVTGGTGFVGANLVRRLLAEGCEVHLLVRPGHASWRLDGILDRVELHVADLGDGAGVSAALARIEPEWTFHLAAHGAYSWEQDLALMTRVNFDGTVNVVQAAIASGCTAIVTAGSSSEYGYTDAAPREDQALVPNSNYAITKAAATHAAQLLSRQSGVPVTTLRLYSVYGPYEDPARLIPSVVRAGLAGGLPRMADPASARDFIHADDVCEAFITAASQIQQPARVLNVASGRQVNLREVAELARAQFSITELPDWGSMPNRPWDTDCWVGDASALKALGWRPQLAFEDGFARTAAWWAAHPELLTAPSARSTGPLTPVGSGR